MTVTMTGYFAVLFLVTLGWGGCIADPLAQDEFHSEAHRQGRPGGFAFQGGPSRFGGGGGGFQGGPGGFGGGGGFQGGHGGFGGGGDISPVVNNIALASGDSQRISSFGIIPSNDVKQATWNFEAPGSTIVAQCKIKLQDDCSSSSFKINGREFCSGCGPIDTITAVGNMQIVFEARQRRQGFRCLISTSSESTGGGAGFGAGFGAGIDVRTGIGAGAGGRDWSYYGVTGPFNWANMNPTCAGQNQSPINIDTSATVGQFPWKALGLHGYDDTNQFMRLVNANRSADLVTQGPFIMGGNLTLNQRYLLQVVIFHWGENDFQGSEHTVDGRYYAGEAQFVHYNSKYSNFREALGQDDGVVALSTFFQISPQDNQELAPLISGLRDITQPGSSRPLNQFNLRSLVPDTYNDFYRYEGSKTTPSCEEKLTRMIFKDPIDISSAQLAQFRTLFNETGGLMTTNIRPIQPLNGRNVLAGQIEPSWSHNGPDGQAVWTSRISATCGGNRQSPINIDTSTVINPSDAPIVATNFNVVPKSIKVNNNDHGVQILPDFEVNPTIVGGPWLTPYEFFHYHFHWGSPTTNGAEHTVNGRRYAGEIHMLVYNQSLGGFGPAFGTEKGVYEVSIFMELSPQDNPNLDPFIAAVENVVPSLSTSEATPFPMGNLLPANLQRYYYYDGAFTAPAPTCSEKADFLLFADPIPISRNQIQKFFQLEDAAGQKILNNFRDLQPLNGRPIFGSL